MTPREAALVGYYDSKPDYYSPLEEFDAVQIAALVDVDVKAPVLDFGCGNGRLGYAVLHPVDGLDISAERVQRAAASGCYRELIVGSVYGEELPGPYQTIFAVEVFEHLAHPERAITAALERLAPGGHLIATVPLRHPDHAHLTVFESREHAAEMLGATRSASITVRKHRHAVLRWDA